MNDAPAPYRILTSRREFVDAIRQAFADIAAVGCRDVWIGDADFADWPLGERPLIEHLTRWAMAHRRLIVLAQSFDDIVRRHPRFAAWRRQWSHVVECRQFEDAEPGQMPTLLLAPGVVTVRLSDRVSWHGSVSHRHADAIQCRELVDAISQRSAEAFPATTLGL